MALRLLILLVAAAPTAAAAGALRRYFFTARAVSRFDRQDVSPHTAQTLLVEFTSPYCIDCKEIMPVLEAAADACGAELRIIDVRERPDLFRKYRLRSTPTILAVDPSGRVKRSWTSRPRNEELLDALT